MQSKRGQALLRQVVKIVFDKIRCKSGKIQSEQVVKLVFDVNGRQ